MKFQGKKQCWEYMGCGKDRGCPAYPDYGRLCWPIAGTKCRQGARGAHAQSLGDCEACEFFKAVVFDGISETS
jgi:hypothetical protein